MTPGEAEYLAARTYDAIDLCEVGAVAHPDDFAQYAAGWAADRERIESDLAGLRACEAQRATTCPHVEAHAENYADGLRRTARLYGVTR